MESHVRFPSHGKRSDQTHLLSLYLHGTTVRLTVAVLLARLGSAVSAMVAALSVITVPAGAVTFTVIALSM